MKALSVTAIALSTATLGAMIGMALGSLTNPNQKPEVSIPVANPDTKEIVTPSPSPVVTPIPFEKLSNCDQLDSIAKSGKSVSQFLADSDVDQYTMYTHAVEQICPWHKDQLAVALNIRSPLPVTVVQPVTVIKEIEVKEVLKPQTGSAVIAESGQNVTEWQKEQMRKRASEKRASEKLSAGERCAWGGSQKDCDEFNRKSR